jgi:hypothetical protein
VGIVAFVAALPLGGCGNATDQAQILQDSIARENKLLAMEMAKTDRFADSLLLFPPIRKDSVVAMGQFRSVGLPYASSDLFFMTEPEATRGRDEYFDTLLFRKYHVPHLRKDRLWRGSTKGKYPAAIFRGPNFDLVFLMYFEIEPGLRDPDVKVYVLDDRQHVRDSILVYRRYHWEENRQVQFVLSSDTVLQVATYDGYHPFNGETFQYDLTYRFVEKRTTTKYKMGSDLKFEKLVSYQCADTTTIHHDW